MKISCVISEFDPFHNGHKYLIERQRENGASHIVAVMSGSFVQRGECAAISKFDRARAAVTAGADLVIELPAVWACAAAPAFARGGVSIIKALNCADSIFFGSECGDITLLENCADALISESFKSAFKKYNDGATPYAGVMQKALMDTAGAKCADVLSSPNNILAVEYIKEMRLQKVGFKAETIKRIGCGHNCPSVDKGFASASDIRRSIKNFSYIKNYIPKSSLDVIKAADAAGDIADTRLLDNVILYKLRTMDLNSLSCLPDVSEGLENRIKQAAESSADLDELLRGAVCKRYSKPRLRRAFACALLNINSDMQSQTPGYIRVLGLNNRGAEILKSVKRSADLPVITKASEYSERLCGVQREIFKRDILATDVRGIACEGKTAMGQDFLKSPFIARL